MTKLSYCLAFTLPLFLLGCGGGGGGSSDDGGDNGGPSAEACNSIDELSGFAKATGRYQGSLEMDGKTYSSAYAFVGPDGKYRLIAGTGDPGETSYIAGQFTGDEGSLMDDSATVYFTEGSDSSNETTGLSGTFEPRTSLTLSSSAPLTIDAELTYVAAKPASQHCMESGDFADVYSDTGNAGSTSLTFDSDGTVTGQTISECVVNGSADSYTVEGGLFFANLELANCSDASFNGDYQAIGGFVFDPTGTSRLVDMIIENDKFALYSKLDRN